MWAMATKPAAASANHITAMLRQKLMTARGLSTVSARPDAGWYTPLANRSVVRVTGPETVKFLQNISTNDMRLLNPSQPCLWAACLNSLGRILCDVFIYLPANQLDQVAEGKEPSTLLLDCDAANNETLIAHLKKYKIRTKVNIDSANDVSVYSLHCDSKAAKLWANNSSFIALSSDPRLPELGWRALSLKEDTDTLAKQPIDNYDSLRYRLGVPEGPRDMPLAASFPLECNMDYLHGVNFDKGCYLGQEVTARAKFVGEIRKRVMPLAFSSALSLDNMPESGQPIKADGKTVGRFRSGCGTVGLGLLYLESAAKDLSMETENCLVEVKSSIPDWWVKGNE